MKKRILWLAVLLSIAFLAACGATGKGGEGTQHPYTWKEEKDGSVLLTISGAVEAGYDWAVSGDAGGIVRVEKLEKSSGARTFYTLAPLSRGSSELTFTCRRAGVLEDMTCRISLRLETDAEGCLRVTDSSERAFAGVTTAGEDTEHPYMWVNGEDGSLRLYVERRGSIALWQALGFDDACVTVADPVYDPEGVLFAVTGAAAGETDLVLSSLEKNFAIQLRLTVDDGLRVTVAAHQAGEYVPRDGWISGSEDFKKAVGAVTLPDGARVMGYETEVWYDGDVRRGILGRIRSMTDGEYWECIVSREIPVSVLLNDYLGGAAEDRTVEICGRTVTIRILAREAGAFWQDDEGRAFGLLKSGKLSLGDMSDAAAQWIGGGARE